MKDFNFIDAQSPQVIEEIYQNFLKDPNSVEASWKSFFLGFEYAQTPDAVPKSPYVDQISPYNQTADSSSGATVGISKEVSVSKLIQAYRMKAHYCARTNPLRAEQGLLSKENILDKAKFSLSDSDMNQSFNVPKTFGEKKTLSQLVQDLDATYCSSIGVEYKYIGDENFTKWLEERIEPVKNRTAFSATDKKAILKDLIRAEHFENFLHLKFVGKKRFSLEGGGSLIPALESMLDYGGGLGVDEFVIGMAHRGRLNVLTNVLRKNYESLFNEFDGAVLPEGVNGDGDVKYHMGFSADRITSSGKQVHISLCPNPSHLEAIGPVLEGMARSKQDLKYSGQRQKVCPVAIHGDAAFAGQGVVMETINMAGLEGFSTGGTVHIVINNQVGFTTHPSDSRSTVYCTDIMKMMDAPIFHVNGDDPEAVVHCAHLAMEIRQKFQRDVVIDLICYRKYGHNESDEPRFTQPNMYKLVDKKSNPADVYCAQLIAEKVISQADFDAMAEAFKNELSTKLDKARAAKPVQYVDFLRGNWAGMIVPTEEQIFAPINTKVDLQRLKMIAQKLSTAPANFQVVNKLQRLLKDREAMAKGEKPFDWGTAEVLAYASLLLESYPVRITGQDVRRGTFTHRHAVWYDENTQERYTAMNHLADNQAAKLSIYDSFLSEYAVLGFEYGFSYSDPKSLCIWEAQFGDFANGAQIIFDQFLSSCESKWQRMSGLVMLLPHGYEGQGPEHSSARLERFLQLCAENNMQVANVTTPTQLFHIMRRQMKRNFRKPLVIMSPKSLLRHPKVTATYEDLANSSFQEVLGDNISPTKVQRIVFCSGKIYYDLDAKREALQTAGQKNLAEKVAIVRIEQLYPFASATVKKILSQYSVNAELLWVQEEPENMGAWQFIRDRFIKMGRDIRGVSRKESASPATGNEKLHHKEQEEIINRVWEGL